jgi:hypothetical protein
MGFIRRLLGGGRPSDAAPNLPTDAAEATGAADPAELDAAEREHELDVLREEQARLDDLAQRQLKYASYSWQPPRQGGDRRADDTDKAP